MFHGSSALESLEVLVEKYIYLGISNHDLLRVGLGIHALIETLKVFPSLYTES